MDENFNTFSFAGSPMIKFQGGTIPRWYMEASLGYWKGDPEGAELGDWITYDVRL